MPICIECSYPVPQLFHVLHSNSKIQKNHAAPPAATPADKPSTRIGDRVDSGPRVLASPSTSAAAPRVPSSLPRRSGEGDKRGRGPVVGAGAGGGGGDVRLTQCPRCKRFADKYVEHDFVVLFIDLVLVKPQVAPTLIPSHENQEADVADMSVRSIDTSSSIA